MEKKRKNGIAILILLLLAAGMLWVVRETEAPMPESSETDISSDSNRPNGSSDDAEKPTTSSEGESSAASEAESSQEEPEPTLESDGKEEPAAEEPAEPDKSKLKPGTNHNHRAEAYAYSPEDVRRWLKNGSKEPDYPTKKLVFLTIDDGPILETGTKMLDTLEREGVGATFFYQGSHVVEMNREQMHRVIEIGSSIAVHSFSHDYKLLYPGRIADTQAILSDYDRALKVMKEMLGEDFSPKSYRYPGGHMSWKKLQAADEGLLAKGVHWMDWNLSVADSVPNADQLPVEVFLKNVRTGTEKMKGNVIVLLMHETHQIDPPLLEEVIRYYKGLGYEFGILK